MGKTEFNLSLFERDNLRVFTLVVIGALAALETTYRFDGTFDEEIHKQAVENINNIWRSVREPDEHDIPF